MRDDPAAAGVPDDPAAARFAACRWRGGGSGAAAYCTHGEVLPYAGRNGFNPHAWCPDCTFYKARRQPRRPDPDLHDDPY